MDSFEPVDMDYDKTGDEGYKWDDNVVKDLELRFNKLREFDETLNESTDEGTIEMTTKTRDALKHDTIELAANQIYDRLTFFFDNDRKRFGILSCYLYIFQYTQINISDAQFLNVVY